jgi:small subunit ribosomal protein S25e
MGGTKKKSLASMEKSQDDESTSADGSTTKTKTKTKEVKGPGERKRVEVLMPRLSDQEFMKPLNSMKAITIYAAAKNLNVNASVARAILASLESKGMVKKAGGFSGHYVWSPVSRS